MKSLFCCIAARFYINLEKMSEARMDAGIPLWAGSGAKTLARFLLKGMQTGWQINGMHHDPPGTPDPHPTIQGTARHRAAKNRTETLTMHHPAYLPGPS